MKQAPVVNIYRLKHVYFHVVEKWRVCAITKLLQITLYAQRERMYCTKTIFFKLMALSDMKHKCMLIDRTILTSFVLNQLLYPV